MHRPLLLSLVTAAALLAPVPASAQESPPPKRGECRQVVSPGSYRVSAPSSQDVVAGEPVTYTVAGEGELDTGYAQLSGYRWATPAERGEVQWTTDTTSFGVSSHVPAGQSTATHTVTLRPTTNTRVSVRWGFSVGCFYADGGSSLDNEVINVAPRLTLTAVRHAPRDYTFSGVASRAGQLLNLYRVNADGTEVLTSQTRASNVGTWSTRRVFLGSGRFGFVLRTGRDMANAPGKSNVRPTVIH